MRSHLTVLALVAACVAPLGARAGDILNIGDAAPPLAVSSFVKGEKVEKFEPGKTYVVEFWATWCGPCRASIPHLTKLAHSFKDKGVQFIGVDVWERDTSLVKPFLEEMGDKMDYSVALDDVPKNGSPNDGAMARTWMKAADEDGIPTAFIVRDGKIAWIGHPMQMDEPLAKVTAGEFDLKAMAAERLATKTKQRKLAAVQEKVYTPYQAGDYKATLAAINEAAASDPELAEALAPVKFVCLCHGVDADAALALGGKLFDSNKDKPEALNEIFWPVIDPDAKGELDPRVGRLALKAARRAEELTKGKEVAILDTLACALFRTGDAAGAVMVEEKALKGLEEDVKDRSNPLYKIFEDRLAQFRKAAEKGEKR